MTVFGTIPNETKCGSEERMPTMQERLWAKYLIELLAFCVDINAISFFTKKLYALLRNA